MVMEEENSVHNPGGDDMVGDPVDAMAEAESSEDSTDEERKPVRTSSRGRRPKKIFTFTKLGGNPSMEDT